VNDTLHSECIVLQECYKKLVLYWLGARLFATLLFGVAKLSLAERLGVKPRGGRCLPVNSACEGLKQTRPANRVVLVDSLRSNELNLFYQRRPLRIAFSVPVYTYKYLFFRMRIRLFSKKSKYLRIRNIITISLKQKAMWRYSVDAIKSTWQIQIKMSVVNCCVCNIFMKWSIGINY